MCRLLLVTAFTCVLSVVTSRAVIPLEGPLWSPNIAEDISLPDDQYPSYSDIFEQRHPPQGLFNTDEDYNVIQRRPPNNKRADKRGLSMFARWNFINNIGKERTPIRSKMYVPEEGINTQTRSRIIGQPLRWG